MSRAAIFRPFRKANGHEPDTVTQMLLRKRARQIATREQFEAIVKKATHPERVRTMLEPLLRPNLPCCVAVEGRHTLGCPVMRAERTGTVQ